MDNLMIGALELSGQPDSYGDGVLEATHLGTTQYGCLPPTIGCPSTLRCHIDDGALETIGANMAFGPTQGVNCPPPATILHLTCVSDGALEAAGTSMVAPSWPNPMTQCPTIGCGPTQAICRL